jgi:hypothetical protein
MLPPMDKERLYPAWGERRRVVHFGLIIHSVFIRKIGGPLFYIQKTAGFLNIKK